MRMKYPSGGKNYIVACSFCGAAVGHACWRVDEFKASGKKKWAPMHLDRRQTIAKLPKPLPALSDADINV